MPELQLPPLDRAFWQAPTANDGALRYLAWGTRQFGHAPIYPALHEGWVYVAVEAGAPLLTLANRAERIVAPALLIIGPRVAFGWNDHANRVSRLLLWMWRAPIHPALAESTDDTVRKLPITAPAMARFGQLHAACRRECAVDDEHSAFALSGHQRSLEAELLRATLGAVSGTAAATLARAQHWLELHLETSEPLARLADFLGLSHSSVQRLFRKELGKSVRQVLAEMRMREAPRLIEDEGLSVKETAFRLGYRHPHDFSRAFRRLVGRSPTERKGH